MRKIEIETLHTPEQQGIQKDPIVDNFDAATFSRKTFGSSHDQNIDLAVVSGRNILQVFTSDHIRGLRRSDDNLVVIRVVPNEGKEALGSKESVVVNVIDLKTKEMTTYTDPQKYPGTVREVMLDFKRAHHFGSVEVDAGQTAKAA